MNVLTRRTRVVSFRLSEEEYHDLMNLCTVRGARSLSDFARSATFNEFEIKITNGESELPIQRLYRRLSVLDREVKRLAKLVESHPPTDAIPDLETASPDESWTPAT